MPKTKATTSPELIREEVERQLPGLMSKSIQELQAEVGLIPMAAEVFRPTAAVNARALASAGKAFISKDKVKAFVCEPDNRKLVDDSLNAGNVGALVALLLQAFNIAGVVPLAIIALAVLLLRMGLNTYCRGYPPEKKAALKRGKPKGATKASKAKSKPKS
jgi:hypothetical protein